MPGLISPMTGFIQRLHHKVVSAELIAQGEMFLQSLHKILLEQELRG